MVDSCEEMSELEASSSEPNLTDIKEMLANIKATVTTILTKNQQFKEEIKLKKLTIDRMNHSSEISLPIATDKV